MKPDKDVALIGILDAIEVLESELQECEARAATLREAIKSSWNTAKVLNNGVMPERVSVSITKQPNQRKSHKQTRYPRPIGDASEEILRLYGRPMKSESLSGALAELGITPSRQTLSSVLLKDHKGRFVGFGRGIYGLAEWKNEEKANEETPQLALTG